MLRRYPSYSIPVFKTRRIFDLPDWGKAAIAREASGTSLVGDQGLKGLNESTVPFPKPTNGLEAIWNHIVRFRGATVFRASFTAPVQRGGQSTMTTTCITERRTSTLGGSWASARCMSPPTDFVSAPSRPSTRLFRGVI